MTIPEPLKLQQRPNRTVRGKKYVKTYIDLPPKTVKSLHWKKGTNLSAMTRDHRLIVRKGN